MEEKKFEDFAGIECAIEYAALAHEKQHRKGTLIPYISHPFAVAMILAREGYSTELIIAGLLHDTLEDTQVTGNDLEMKFGKRIAFLVKAVSEPDKSLPWEVRKQHTVEFLNNAEPDILRLACADKLHNINRMLHSYRKCGEKVFSRFRKGEQEQKWYFRSLVEVFFNNSNSVSHETIFAEFRRVVFELFPD
jgi:(p)ppGpp synthase/HD superfamily hydrolase